MTKLYLITGFLGAGKTTFLHKFAGLFPGRKIALVINEFGAAGVDGALLQDLNVQLTEINNGSIFCACKLEDLDGEVCVVDCVGPLVEVRPFVGEPSELNRLVVLFGHGLPAKKSIREAVSRFPQCSAAITQQKGDLL